MIFLHLSNHWVACELMKPRSQLKSESYHDTIGIKLYVYMMCSQADREQPNEGRELSSFDHLGPSGVMICRWRCSPKVDALMRRSERALEPQIEVTRARRSPRRWTRNKRICCIYP